MNVSFESEIKVEHYVVLGEESQYIRFEKNKLMETLEQVLLHPISGVTNHSIKDVGIANDLVRLGILQKDDSHFDYDLYKDVHGKAAALYEKLYQTIEENHKILNSSVEIGTNPDLDDLEFDIEM